jgi:flagellar biosynthesis protein FlhA
MGMVRGMTVANAVKTYSILSIGDGLVSQIPSVIISVSSGFLVTKISSNQSVGQDIAKQFLRTGRPLMTAAGIMAAMALVPGMPKVQFLVLAVGAALLGKATAKAEKALPDSTPAPRKKADKEPVEDLLDMDRISVHVGVRLITMVDPRKSNTIFDRIGALRRQFAQQLGVVVPLVRLRDDLNLPANGYEIRLSEIPVAKGSLEPDMFLAMDSGAVRKKADGIKTMEPVYGLPALWIPPDKKEAAELSSYTVIDPESVFITHLSETLKRHAAELLTREDVQLLIDRLRKNQPSLVGEMVGAESHASVALLQRVLKNLLRSGIAIRELTAILEALAEHAPKTKNPVTLTEMVRKSLSRTITEQYKDEAGKISAITFDPALEHRMVAALRQENGELVLGLPAETALELNRKVAAAWKSAMDKGKDKAVLLCDARLRASLAQMFSRTLQMLPVAAYDEIVLGTELEPVETIVIQQDESEMANGREPLVAALAGA